MPYAHRQDIYAHNPDQEEWEKIGWRDSVWLENYGAVGDISASDDWYEIFQYGDILEGVADAVDEYGIDIQGYAELSPTGHKMSARVDFHDDQARVEPTEGDVINLGLKVRSGHSGYHGLKYDVGAEREVCSNGMVAFVSDFSLKQSHQETYDEGLARQAVEAVMDGTDKVEERIQDAQSRSFHNYDEALLVMTDFGLDQYFDDSVDTLRDALEEEADGDRPTLYETYNAATRALTHETDNLPQHRRDEGFERASKFLDHGNYGLPEADYLGKQAVDNRYQELTEEDADPVLEDEEEVLGNLLTVHSMD